MLYLSLKKPASEIEKLSNTDKCFHSEVEFTCPKCGKMHSKLWTVKRKMADTFGHFPVFRLNGKLTVVDGTLPHTVERLPTDAIELSDERCTELWHKNGHYFG